MLTSQSEVVNTKKHVGTQTTVQTYDTSKNEAINVEAKIVYEDMILKRLKVEGTTVSLSDVQ